MNILFVLPNHHLPQALGGAQWSMHYFCTGLQSLGDNVAVLCPLKNQGWIALKNKLKRKLSGRLLASDLDMGYPTFRGWDVHEGFDELAAHFKPDAIVVIGANPGPVAIARRALDAGLPVVYMAIDVAFDNKGISPAELNGARFTSNSHFTMDTLKDRFGIQSEKVIHPPINIEKCQVAKPGGKVVLVNPHKTKGGEIAIQLAELRKDIPFVFYEAWAVSNKEILDIKERARKSGNVEWRPPVLDIRKIFSEARIILMPSQWPEAWGRVASESHCSGIPVVGSAIGGLTEAIGPGGLAVPPDAPISVWLDALSTLWDNEEEWNRVSLQAREYSLRDEIKLEAQVTELRSLLHNGMAYTNPNP